MDVVHDDGMTDRIITRAVGEELRRARDTVGWTRAELVERIPSDIQARTYATYEHGTRQCTVARFIEICETLGVAASDVLTLAQQRAEMHLRTIGLQVDLHALVADTKPEFKELRRWAHNRITASPEGPAIARLTAPVVHELAIFFGATRSDLIRYLVKFTPASAPLRGRRQDFCGTATN